MIIGWTLLYAYVCQIPMILWSTHMQVYTIETTWSNATRYEIYRRYAAFFSFQVILL